MSQTEMPAVTAVDHSAERRAICARKDAITERVRAVDPFAALEARERVPEVVYWAALRLAASRTDLYDALAHVRCLHDTTALRIDWLDAVMQADLGALEGFEAQLERAIRERGPHDAFVAWAHACIDDGTWEVLRTARVRLRGRR